MNKLFGLIFLGTFFACASNGPKFDLPRLTKNATGCAGEISISHQENAFDGAPEAWSAACQGEDSLIRYRCSFANGGKVLCLER